MSSVGILQCKKLTIELDSMMSGRCKIFADGKQIGCINSFKLEAKSDTALITLDMTQSRIVGEDGKRVKINPIKIVKEGAAGKRVEINPIIVSFARDMKKAVQADAKQV